MADNIFSGFAQGWQTMSTLKDRKAAREAAAARQTLAEKLGLERLDLERTRTDIAKQDLGMRATAADVLAQHNKFMEGIETDKLNLQKRANDLDVAKVLIGPAGVMDTNTSPEVRKFKLRALAGPLGLDTKSAQYKDLETLLTSPAPELEGYKQIIAQMLPTAPPGSITSMAVMMAKDPANAMKVIEGFKNGGTDPSKLVAGVDPSSPSGRSLQVPKVGLPVPGAMTETPEEKLRTKELELGMASDQKVVDEIRTSAGEAQNMKPEIDAYKTVLDSGKFIPGSFSGLRLGLGQFARFTSLDQDPEVKKALDAIGAGAPEAGELLDTLGKRLALSMSAKVNRVTNLSLGLTTDSVVNLSKTAEGNRLVVNLLERTNSREIQLDNDREEYLAKYGSLRPNPKEFPGVRTFFQHINDLEAADPIVNDDIKKQLTAAVTKGEGIKLEDMVKDAAGDFTGKMIKLPDNKSYKVVGKEGSFNIIELSDGVQARLVYDAESIAQLPKGPFVYVDSKTGRVYQKNKTTDAAAAKPSTKVPGMGNPMKGRTSGMSPAAIDAIIARFTQGLKDKGVTGDIAKRAIERYRKTLEANK